MKTLFVVLHYDYEDTDWSSVEFIGLSENECYEFIDENFEDYYSEEWNKEENGNFKSKEMGKDWLKTELNLEIIKLGKNINLANLYKRNF